jgi:hypothetical protein
MVKLTLKSSSLWLLLFLFSGTLFSQNKSGYVRVCGYGNGGVSAFFNGDTSRAVSKNYFSSMINQFFFMNGSSNVCDSASGNLLMLCNGSVLYDTLGNIIENGDSLQPYKIYHHNTYPESDYTQGSLMLPKGSNGLYYVFTPTITDTKYDYWYTNPFGDGRFPYDLLQYHVVDMNANVGMGKVIQKNIPLLQNVEISKVGMMAVRHSNGYDWWLLKQAPDTNLVYTFLVTKDTILLDTIQGFEKPHFRYNDVVGQSCFSSDGSKYAYLQGQNSKLFVADFDRCYGILSNPKVYNIPIDSTTHPFWTLDSTSTGVCFSPNDKFIYLTQPFHVYQFELNESDSALAWYRVIRGADTTLQKFENYGQLYKGIDGRIYIGKTLGISSNANSVIDKPNIKGLGCEFCKKCFHVSGANSYSSSFSNMPDFNLGGKTCFPLSLPNPPNEGVFEVFPNPAFGKFQIKCKNPNSKKELYNSIGQLIISTKENEIDVRHLSKGVYFLSVGFETKKIIVE